MMAIWAGSFELTDTKTANYQCKNAEIVPVDTSGGTFIVSAPLIAALGQSASFGVQMQDQKNPITIFALESMAQPRIGLPAVASFDILFDGCLYWCFNGTDWFLI